MRYYFTDFFNWEQPKIDQLCEEGKFVYPVIDVGGDDYVIRRWGYCNRFAFLITDEDILKEGITEIDAAEFAALNGEEDVCLVTPMKDVSAKCAALQREYEKKQREATEEVRRRYA